MTAAATKGITPLDPRDRSTWKNIPCPVDLSDVQRELTLAGGVNEYGEPNFIIVWAQEYRTWDAGAMRIHFDEEAVDAIQTPTRYACTPDVYARAVAWLEKENQRRRDAYMNLDFASVGQIPDVGEYLKANEISDNYMLLPSDEESVGRIARLMPDGWMYVNGLHTFEHIGQQCFYVLQWLRPIEFGDPANWNDLRFDEQYSPEADRDEIVDILGPFPSRGMYDNVCVRIAEIETYEDRHPVEINKTIRREICRFKMPTIENAVDPVRELLTIRERLTDEEKDPVKRTQKRRTDFEDGWEERDERARRHFRERFNAAKPVGGGNPTNISSNKTKAH